MACRELLRKLESRGITILRCYYKRNEPSSCQYDDAARKYYISLLFEQAEWNEQNVRPEFMYISHATG